MAIAKLTSTIWWSNMQGPVESTGRYKAIVDLSGPYTADNQHYRLSQVDAKAMIFRLPITEDEKVTDNFIANLDDIAGLLERNESYPVLIHCMAGQCRSPIVAVFFAWRGVYPSKKNTYELLEKMRLLAPLNGGVDEHRLFHRSLREYMLGACSS